MMTMATARRTVTRDRAAPSAITVGVWSVREAVHGGWQCKIRWTGQVTGIVTISKSDTTDINGKANTKHQKCKVKLCVSANVYNTVHHCSVETDCNGEWFSNTKQALLRPHSVGTIQSDQQWNVMDMLRMYIHAHSIVT